MEGFNCGRGLIIASWVGALPHLCFFSNSFSFPSTQPISFLCQRERYSFRSVIIFFDNIVIKVEYDKKIPVYGDIPKA